MIKVGDVCPLFFNPIKDKFGIESDFIQKFHASDKIIVQVLANGGEQISATLNNLSSGENIPIQFSTYEHNNNVTVSYAVLTGSEDGCYSISISGIGESEPFLVCSSDILLEETLLIRYSHKDNNSVFDNIFWVNEEQQVFDFRIEGGFLPSGYASRIDNEQYRNQMQEIVELYSVPYDNYTLTVGNASGVPYWIAKFINRILCLSDFKINGENYVRSESSIPEMEQVIEGGQLFHVSIVLEPRTNDISGIGGLPELASSSSVVGFCINNPKDGEMLQYKGEKSAFVNVDKVEV